MLTLKITRNILGGWGGRRRWPVPYHFHVPTVLKSGLLQLLEYSETVRDSRGIAVPLIQT